VCRRAASPTDGHRPGFSRPFTRPVGSIAGGAAQPRQIYGHGRLANTGYLSILPVDQGIEHSAAASFAPNPLYFDPANIVELAIEGGCNAVATTFGVLGAVARRYAHRIPFIVKMNHNELLTYPNKADQVMFGSAREAVRPRCSAEWGRRSTSGSEQSTRQLQEVSRAFKEAHDLGMFTVLWCYTRNNAFKVDGVNYEVSADLTGQANHIGVTIEADIIKAEAAGEQRWLQRPQWSRYELVRQDQSVGLRQVDDRPSHRSGTVAGRQLLHGPIGLINSGGESKGDGDLAAAVRTAVINKRAGGQGLISGSQVVPASDGRGRGLAECDPGRVPGQLDHRRLITVA
jgi:class I fructose-bisphosphate aldolase